ncbi:protein of unknown function [Epibacterium ulvae]|uniref:DUF4174 domain-containing protein n=1 Tax=Epibacterium ulvae TaxID=1156985 RepID=A0A1G5PXF8_9RHOB|nr:DUF4174 domain-containing protein [Epibacterium ulvae]SCZ54335.1 protein of unknown function [Epibacterium ulvae]
MRPFLAIVLTLFLTSPIGAEEVTAGANEPLFMAGVESNLNDFLWKKRPILVFADTEADPRYQEQLALLRENEEALRARDVVVLFDSTPDAKSPWRTKLRPRGFQLVLIGKDGGVKLRKPFPWTVRELSRTIDKIPTRLREVEDRRDS